MNDSSAPDGARLRLTYEAFCRTHERAWRGFARTQVGAHQDAAELVVADMKRHLHRNWELALRQEIPAAYAWRLLKEHIGSWLDTQAQPTAVQTAALDAVISGFCRRAQWSLENLPEQLGLLSAILALPERQRDIVVLTYCLDLDDDEAAAYLSTPATTLRSNRRHARRRLATAIGRPDLAEKEVEA
ncbi:sigma factor-like helix-turn-helix DNA-binding protein [Streptomyces sp. TLI_053]|uniref:sigma factor-like helix-turn-helix DNA-binding protein n=1 Tax=Streptomyces sp. TLI_053 TaxID=1855352 RepID=UPI0013520D60|nr:sigma factor-like helix-turn-helix DNA-binding protein [Streptomyces sp. TLI_053]